MSTVAYSASIATRPTDTHSKAPDKHRNVPTKLQPLPHPSQQFIHPQPLSRNPSEPYHVSPHTLFHKTALAAQHKQYQRPLTYTDYQYHPSLSPPKASKFDGVSTPGPVPRRSHRKISKVPTQLCASWRTTADGTADFSYPTARTIRLQEVRSVYPDALERDMDRRQRLYAALKRKRSFGSAALWPQSLDSYSSSATSSPPCMRELNKVTGKGGGASAKGFAAPVSSNESNNTVKRTTDFVQSSNDHCWDDTDVASQARYSSTVTPDDILLDDHFSHSLDASISFAPPLATRQSMGKHPQHFSAPQTYNVLQKRSPSSTRQRQKRHVHWKRALLGTVTLPPDPVPPCVKEVKLSDVLKGMRHKIMPPNPDSSAPDVDGGKAVEGQELEAGAGGVETNAGNLGSGYVAEGRGRGDAVGRQDFDALVLLWAAGVMLGLLVAGLFYVPPFPRA